MARTSNEYHRVQRLFFEKSIWTPKELGRRLRLSRTTIHRHLNTMLSKRVIARSDDGPFTVYSRLPFKFSCFNYR